MRLGLVSKEYIQEIMKQHKYLKEIHDSSQILTKRLRQPTFQSNVNIDHDSLPNHTIN